MTILEQILFMELIKGDAEGEIFHRVDDAAVDYEEAVSGDWIYTKNQSRFLSFSNNIGISSKTTSAIIFQFVPS